MTTSSLPARYLGQHELAELVKRLAGQPELWGDQVSYAGGRRHFASIRSPGPRRGAPAEAERPGPELRAPRG